MLGRHNTVNALIAQAVLDELGVSQAADGEALAAAAEQFEPLASRLQLIGVVAGVTFVDDSLSTNVLPTLAALDAFPDRRVALIAGGFDRGVDYAPLAAGLARRRAPVLVLGVPASGPRIIEHHQRGRLVTDDRDMPCGRGRRGGPVGVRVGGPRWRRAAFPSRPELRRVP